jgi:hypothetical protein
VTGATGFVPGSRSRFAARAGRFGSRSVRVAVGSGRGRVAVGSGRGRVAAGSGRGRFGSRSVRVVVGSRSVRVVVGSRSVRRGAGPRGHVRPRSGARTHPWSEPVWTRRPLRADTPPRPLRCVRGHPCDRGFVRTIPVIRAFGGPLCVPGHPCVGSRGSDPGVCIRGGSVRMVVDRLIPFARRQEKTRRVWRVLSLTVAGPHRGGRL